MFPFLAAELQVKEKFNLHFHSCLAANQGITYGERPEGIRSRFEPQTVGIFSFPRAQAKISCQN